jgi:hypothetical protein
MNRTNKLLVLGGSLTDAWRQIDKSFYEKLEVTPDFAAWNAQAWRHKVNDSPFKHLDGALYFKDVFNKSVFFPDGDRNHPVHGSTGPIKLDDVGGIVFTQPATERAFILRLFQAGFCVYSHDLDESLFHRVSKTITPISDEVFFQWWLAHQHYAGQFLELLSNKYPGLPIFVTPEILPRLDQDYSEAFRHYYRSTAKALMRILQERFSVTCCVQPASTIDISTLTTLDRFAAPAPDPHHYTPEFVTAIADTSEFLSFIARLRHN